ncbi:integral membrane protein [Colletotrichum tofieldiae]|nr:integral membrane protein [Colletotrichum tofieldiae]
MLRLYAKIYIASSFHMDDYAIHRIWRDGAVFATYAAITFMTGYYLPVFFLKVLATCFNQRAIFVANTAVSTIADMAVLCLPIPVAITLRMRLKVMAMLGAGGVATAASVVRMILVVHLQKSDDVPVDFIRFNLLGYVFWPSWLSSLFGVTVRADRTASTAEVSTGMICACLPAVNVILMHHFDCSQDSSRNTGGGSNLLVELKFLKFKQGRFRTQKLTAPTAVEVEQVASETENHTTPIEVLP